VDNIILIGMAAVGKSTVGKRLADKLTRPFVDTDLLMEAWWGAPLQSIRDFLGLDAFLQAEAEQVLRLRLAGCVIATGGSVIYSEEAMEHLRKMGSIVYLRAPFETIAKRLTNADSRGLALRAGQSIRDLYEERTPLYARHALFTVDADNADPDQISSAIVLALTREQELS
jgi:shikimate kinase